MTKIIIKKIRGFTLIEVMVTLLIVAGLAALAIPNLMTQVSKTRAQEAVPILRAIYAAQMDFDRENFPVDSVYSTDINQLDVNSLQGGSGGAPRNFGLPDVASAGSNLSCSGGGGGIEVGRMDSTFNPAIRLFILNDGRILCQTIVAAACPGTCTRLGFTECCP